VEEVGRGVDVIERVVVVAFAVVLVVARVVDLGVVAGLVVARVVDLGVVVGLVVVVGLGVARVVPEVEAGEELAL
jgi:hypothetical protein